MGVNILLIHQYFLEKDDPGGSRFNELTRLWVEQGHSVTVVCGMLNYLTGKIPEKYNEIKYHQSEYMPGLEVLRCHVSSEYYAGFVGRLRAYFSFVWYGVRGIQNCLKHRQYDVIVATSPPLFVGMMAWIASRLKKVPYVFEVRDLWPESAIDTGVLQNRFIIYAAYRLEQFIYRRAFMINVLTPAFRERLINKKKISPQKITFIPNACDFSMTEPLFESFDRAAFRHEKGWANKFIVTYVGVHGEANHLIQLLDVAEKLRNTRIRIVMIGDGAQKQGLVLETKNRNLENVEFIDPMPKREVMRYIMASDLGTSVLKKVDTFKTVYSNKTFDYMACRVPVLMLIDGVSRQLVEAAKCGVYAEPENIDQIATCIMELEGDTDNLTTMGQNGYTYAKVHFDRNVLAMEYIREIQKRLTSV